MPRLNKISTLCFDSFEWVTFDCYGTLIDWEAGLNASLRTILAAHGIEMRTEKILELYGELEAELESESREYMPYREVLENVVMGFGRRLRFIATSQEIRSLANSLGSWEPFPDTIAALHKLKQKYKLGIISNTDDDLFAETEKRLGIAFDEVVTAEQVRSYKPSFNNFRAAIERIGVPKEKVLHAAQSVYHDVIPARALGIANVWVNRRGGKAGSGATKSALGKPDLEVRDLKSFAAMAL